MCILMRYVEVCRTSRSSWWMKIPQKGGFWSRCACFEFYRALWVSLCRKKCPQNISILTKWNFEKNDIWEVSNSAGRGCPWVRQRKMMEVFEFSDKTPQKAPAKFLSSSRSKFGRFEFCRTLWVFLCRKILARRGEMIEVCKCPNRSPKSSFVSTKRNFGKQIEAKFNTIRKLQNATVFFTTQNLSTSQKNIYDV